MSTRTSTIKQFATSGLTDSILSGALLLVSAFVFACATFMAVNDGKLSASFWLGLILLDGLGIAIYVLWVTHNMRRPVIGFIIATIDFILVLAGVLLCTLLPGKLSFGQVGWGLVDAVILIGMFIAWRVVNSPFGRVLVAIRDNPARARALGYNVEKYKIVAFVISAGLAGLAGGVFAISHGFASLQELNWTTSGKVVLITVLGGIGTLWGGPVGAAIVVQLEDWLASSGFEGTGIILGAIFVLIVLLFRHGVWGTGRQVVAWYLWWVGTESGQIRREAMVSRLHYMLHQFSDFDAPMTFSPPTTGATPAATPAA